ncbi:MAG: hypothetical protein R3B09_11495 [Nannocystaceae bacterium]
MALLRTAWVASIALSLTLGAPLSRALARAAEAEEPEVGEPSEPSSAPAEQVELRNGGKVQGSIIELLPGDSLTIVSAATGETKTFRWAEIARYTQSGAWVRADEAGGSTPAAEESPGKGELRGPRLHIETTKPAKVKLFEITSEMVASGGNVVVHGMTYRPICTSPCDEVIDASAGHPYFFGGDKLSTSRRFNLPTYGDVTVTVKPGSRGLRFGGMILGMVVGPTVAIGGGAWLLVNEVGAGSSSRIGGPLALIGAGVALVGGGIAMMIVGRTRYTFNQGGIGLLRPLRFG